METGDTITVTLGEQVFAPIQYNSFRVGPFSCTTTIKEGESPEAAYTRAHNFLIRCARIAYTAERNLFFDRYEGRDK